MPMRPIIPENVPDDARCCGRRCGSGITHQDGDDWLCAAHAGQRLTDANLPDPPPRVAPESEPDA